MAKIDRVQDLPIWFNVAKYRQAETFGEKEWFEQLAFRKWLLMNNPEYPVRRTITRGIFEEIPYKDESGEILTGGAILCTGDVAIDHAEAMSDWRDWVGKAAAALRANPFAVEQQGEEYFTKAQPVTSMTVSHLKDILVQGALKAQKSGNSPLLQDYIDTFKHEEVKRQAVYHRPFALEPINRAAVMVNLHASDPEIRQAFEVWLKDARANHPSKGRREKPSNWVRYGLLPYLDLLIWEMETDSDIPDRVMAEAISPNDAGEDNLRKTLAPLAAKLMSDLSALQALIAARV